MAEIVALSGQPFREVWDGMTWADYRRLSRFWRDWPPVPVSLALLAKLGPQQRGAGPDGSNTQGDGLAELEALIGRPPPSLESPPD